MPSLADIPNTLRSHKMRGSFLFWLRSLPALDRVKNEVASYWCQENNCTLTPAEHAYATRKTPEDAAGTEPVNPAQDEPDAHDEELPTTNGTTEVPPPSIG